MHSTVLGLDLAPQSSGKLTSTAKWLNIMRSSFQKSKKNNHKPPPPTKKPCKANKDFVICCRALDQEFYGLGLAAQFSLVSWRRQNKYYPKGAWGFAIVIHQMKTGLIGNDTVLAWYGLQCKFFCAIDSLL